MAMGASVGREGPSVQVGAAVMLAWGNFCRKYNFAFRGLSTNELIATGAAGGLAAAFNAPLAGVIFAIEELGRSVMLRWERRVLLGVLAAGFILVGLSKFFMVEIT
jgi:H+/Cl- antiporter ClcA